MPVSGIADLLRQHSQQCHCCVSFRSVSVASWQNKCVIHNCTLWGKRAGMSSALQVFLVTFVFFSQGLPDWNSLLPEHWSEHLLLPPQFPQGCCAMIDSALTSHRKGQRRIPLYTCNLGPNVGKNMFPFIFLQEQYVCASSFGIL